MGFRRGRGRSPMNLPNTITVARLALALAFFVSLSVYQWLARGAPPAEPGPPGPVWLIDVAFALFVVAALTDWVDGYLARRMKQVTAFGRLADPLVDKILVCGAFVYFLGLGPATFTKDWMVVVILSREFIVTGVRSMAESRGVEFSALYWGKAKMWVQSITAGTVLFYYGHLQGIPWAMWLTQIAVWLTVLATVASLLPYMKKAFSEVLD